MSPLDSKRTLAAVIVLVVLSGLCFYGLALKYYGTFIRGWDAQMYYMQIRSLVIDGDAEFTNEMFDLTPNRWVFFPKKDEPVKQQDGTVIVDPLERVATPDGVHEDRDWSRTKWPVGGRNAEGGIACHYTVGWALMVSPVFAVTHAQCSVLDVSPTGYSRPYEIASTLWVFAVCMAGMAMFAGIVAKYCNIYAAIVLAIAAFWATNVSYYACVMPLMTHALAFAVVAVVLYTAFRLYDDPLCVRTWLLAGAAMVLLVLLRPTDVVVSITLFPACFRLFTAKRHVGQLALPAIVAIGVFTGVGVQLCMWRLSYGHWMLNAYSNHGESFDWSAPGLPGILISVKHGAWLTHPIYALGAAGLVAACLLKGTPRRWLWVSMLAAVAAHTFVHASWWSWWFGHAFGHRLFVDTAPLSLMGVAFLLHRATQPWRGVLTGFIALLVMWNMLLIVTLIKDFLPEAHQALNEMTYNEFFALPLDMIKSFF